VKAFAEKDAKLDIVVHNAGISTTTHDQQHSAQDFELVYATNFLGSFFMTYLLEDLLSPSARVILTTSHGQYAGRFTNNFSIEQVKGRRESGFHCPSASRTPAACYANTKAMQCVFAKLLQRRFDQQRTGAAGRVAHTFTPGFTSTAIFSKTLTERWREDPGFMFLKTTEGLLATNVEQGAATGLWLASSDEELITGAGNGGRYWDRMIHKSCSADLLDEVLLARLWQRWEADVGVEWR
jgi:NAD(P)-dependent dehydrogenase (short-subunit alcohol dehydrogenase family)